MIERHNCIVFKNRNRQITNVPKLLSSLNVCAGKQSNVWEAQVLVSCEHSTGKQVGLAHVVNEPADVAIETGVNAVRLRVLQLRGE